LLGRRFKKLAFKLRANTGTLQITSLDQNVSAINASATKSLIPPLLIIAIAPWGIFVQRKK
jgi:hypothetical protein